MTHHRSRAIINVLRIRKRNGSRLTPRERDEVLWFREHGDDSDLSWAEYYDIMNQDTQPMVDGEFGELLGILLDAVLPAEDAKFVKDRTVWK